MALDYITNPTGLFYRIGKLIKYINAHQTMPATTLPAELKAIADPFEAADMTEQVIDIFDRFAGWQNDQISIRQTLARYADNVLSDRNSVLEQLGLTSAGLSPFFWDTFIAKMVADGQTVEENSVSLGSATPVAGNHGNGTIVATITLDAFNAPSRGAPVLLANFNKNSELAITETMIFECTSDVAKGATSGSESMSWRGGIAGPSFDWDTEGSGDGPTLTVAGNGGLITDGEFDNWSANTPTSWTIASGIAGTHVKQETTNYYRSGSAMRFVGDGAQATISITQALDGRLDPRRAYMLSVRLKSSAAAPAAGDFQVTLSGTTQDGGAYSSTVVSVGHAAFTTSFALKSGVLILPIQRLLSPVLTVKVINTLTNAVSLYIDSIALTPVTYHGGIGAVAVPGSIDFTEKDKFTLAVSGLVTGLIQAFFRRKYGVQLPSDGTGSETIADTLAT